MINSKLLRIIQTLDESEIHKFDLFIQSPYWNKKKELILFWNSILERKENLKEELKPEDWDKNIFFQIIFPQKRYTDVAMRKVMSAFTKLLEKFIITEGNQLDEWHNKKMLLQCYGKKNLKKEFDQTMVELKQNIHLAPINNHDSSLELFEIHQLYYKHPHTEKLKIDEKKLTEGMDYLDNFYLSSKLHYSSEQLNRQNIFDKKYHIPLLKEVRTHLEKVQPQSKHVQLYLKIQYLLEDGYSLEDFSSVEKLYEYCYEMLTHEKRYANLLFMINILTRAIGKGHTQLVRKNLELYQFGIQQNLLIQNNRISHETFTNIVVYAASLNENLFVQNFIKDYETYLDHSIRELAVEYCHALIAFYKKDYSDVIFKMENYSSNQGLFDVRAKSLLIRALVEQYISNPNSFLYFKGKIPTIDQFFRRKKKELGEERIKGYLKLLSYSKKLVVLLQNRNPTTEDWNKLKSKIDNEQVLYARKWLLKIIPNE